MSFFLFKKEGVESLDGLTPVLMCSGARKGHSRASKRYRKSRGYAVFI